MKIVLAPVTYRYLEKLTAWGIGQLLSCPEPKFFQVGNTPDAEIARARSQVASDFLRTESYDALMFLDDDIAFSPADAVKLAKHIENGKDIVGGAYVTKSPVPNLASRLYDHQTVSFTPEAKAVEIMYLAAGFSMISRKVFQKLSERLPLCFAGMTSAKSFWPFYQTMLKSSRNRILGKKQTEYLSEDFAFCERARDAGFKIWLDPSIRLKHIGAYAYTLEDMKIFENGKAPITEINVTKEVAM